MSNSTVDLYRKQAEILEVETINKISKAPQRRGYNRTFGMSIPSVSDITREFNLRMRELDRMCRAMNDGEGILAEEEPDTMVTLKKED